MRSWQELQIDEINEILKIAGIFEVWSYNTIPYGKFKVKILQNRNNLYIGVPNIAVKEAQTDNPVWISGLGLTPDDALKDTIDNLFKSINEEKKKTNELRFEWADVHDF